MTGLWLLLLELSGSEALVKFWCKSLALTWYSADPTWLIIPGVAQITAEENREYRHNVPTSHTLITDEGERALIALLSHQGHCVLCAPTLLSSLSNESSHFVLIWNEAPCVMIHFNLETIHIPWQKFPLNFIFVLFYLCLMAINSKKYIKTSIKIIYVSDYFYCQKSKNLWCQFYFCSTLQNFIYLVWNVLCNAAGDQAKNSVITLC